ncbi:MAG: M20/M25/M40 family metallo-hydrolase, partial [Bacillota bacterium]|nr:M20/M25/M40 family metallo-hydrolase [Bacillota bacterium]
MIALSEELLGKISKEVEAREEELLKLLSELVFFPTVSPPARNTKVIQDFIERNLNDMGFHTEMWDVYPNDPNVVGILSGQSPQHYNSLIVNGHVDVAEVGDDKEWDSSPFTARVKDGSIYGRGVADMKGGIASSLMAIRILQNLGIQLQGDLQFQSVI